KHRRIPQGEQTSCRRRRSALRRRDGWLSQRRATSGLAGLGLRDRGGQAAERVEVLRLLLHLGAPHFGRLGGRRNGLALVQRLVADEDFHLVAVQRLPLEQRDGDPVQRRLVLDQELLGAHV